MVADMAIKKMISMMDNPSTNIMSQMRKLRILCWFLLWPGFIPDSQLWAPELWANMGSENLKTKISSPSASILSWLVSPSLLLLNPSSAVVLRQEVGELLQVNV